jgi:cytochrome P450/thioesterase domain-containing protein
VGGACIAFQAPGVDGAESPMGSVEEMARCYVKEMRSIQPRGPYAIAGHSAGGVVAYEMAQTLREQGETVSPLMLIDSTLTEAEDNADQSDEVMALFEVIGVYCRFSAEPRTAISSDQLAKLPDDQQRKILWKLLDSSPGAAHVVEVYRKGFTAIARYRPRYYPGPVVLFRSNGGFPTGVQHPKRRILHQFNSPTLGWAHLCPNLRVVEAAGDHFTMVLPPHANALASAMQKLLDTATSIEIGLDRLRPIAHARTIGRALIIDGANIQFDPHHVDLRDDPYPILNQLRETTPIFQDALSRWWVTRHADVSNGLRNKSLSVDARKLEYTHHINDDSVKPSAMSAWFRNQDQSPLARLYNNFLLFLDPPRHTLLRKAFLPLFSPESVQHLTRYIDERVSTLIANMRANIDADVIRDFALPLPVSVISMIYGVPDEDTGMVTEWARDLSTGLDTSMSHQVVQKAEQSADNITRYLRDHVARLRSASASSTFALLLNVAEVIANGVTPDELVAHLAMSYFAGFETTTNVIGNGTLALLRHPEQFALLREDPSRVEGAVEELLRYDCPILYTLRFALEDTEVAGQRVQRGSPILFMLGAANRDPSVFPDPDRLDIARPARHHVAFSHGAHYCMGAALARLELQCVFLALAKERFQLVPGGLVWRKTFDFRGLDQFRITWRTAPKPA